MGNINLGDKGLIFAKIIWKNEPLTSKALTEICEKELGWKRTTTYTMLKSLCEKGIFENNHGKVSSLMTEEEYGLKRGREVLHDNFSNSLPKFIAAFTKESKLSDEDIEELKSLIDSFKEE